LTSLLFPYTTLFRSDNNSMVSLPASILQKVNLFAWPQKECKIVYDELESPNQPELIFPNITDRMLCMQSYPKSTCKGDSVGPLIDRKSTRLNSSHVS